MAVTVEAGGTARTTDRKGSARAVALVSSAHFTSHFYLLLLPPLFPLLREAYGVGYTELGFAISVFSIVTACTQAPVGFAVDRFGARRILAAGLLLEGAAFVLIGLAPFYGTLVALMAVAGLANAVYHPADYSLLNASVDPRRMGRAFSFHTSAGMLGNAVAPVTMVFLMTLMDWRAALALCGAVGIGVGLVVILGGGVLKDRAARAADGTAEPDGAGAAASGATGIRLLLSAPILLGTLFFFGMSVAGYGIQSFSVSALHILHDAPIVEATTVLSAYLFASPVGVLAGGWVADRIRRRHDAFAATCIVMVAICIGLVAALRPSLPVVAGLFVVAGFFSGMVAPSRDMLIRSMTPPSEIAKVFGFVSTGFNLGGIIAPVTFGFLLDRSDNPGIVFWTVSLVSLATVFTVLTTGRARSRPRGGGLGRRRRVSGR
ncbi:MAG: MFS transporter [Immundisolibacterales bacterium]|nr:MFS transporter [Immundisolibacterales bacterium]